MKNTVPNRLHEHSQHIGPGRDHLSGRFLDFGFPTLRSHSMRTVNAAGAKIHIPDQPERVLYFPEYQIAVFGQRIVDICCSQEIYSTMRTKDNKY